MVQEWKRILLNKQMLLLIAFLLVANLLLFSGTSLEEDLSTTITQTRHRMDLLTSYRDGDITTAYLEKQIKETDVILQLFDYQATKQKFPDEYLLIYQSEEAVLRHAHADIAHKFDQGQYDEAEIRQKRALLGSVRDSAVYSFTYQEKLDQTLKNAETLSQISIFQNDTGTVDRNIQKTAADYAAMADIAITPGNDSSTVMLLQYRLMPLFGILLAIALVGKAIEEKKYRLCPLIFSCVNGRGTLMRWRTGGLLTGSALFSALLSGSTMLAALWLFGPVDASRMVQSIPELFSITVPMTLGELWVLYIVQGILLQIAMTGLIWFVFSFIEHRTIAITILAGILGGSVLLYDFIPDQSVAAFLKYTNLAAGMDFGSMISTYRNVSLGPLLVEKNWLAAGTLLLTLIITFPLCVWHGTYRYSLSGHGRVYRMFQMLFDKGTGLYHRAVSRLPFVGIEAYKALVIRRGVFVLLALVLILLQVYQPKEPMYTGKADFMREFYAHYTNEGLTEGVQEYVRSLREKLDQVESEWMLAVDHFNSGSISLEEYEIALRIYGAYDVQRQGLDEIQNRIEYIRQQEEQGYTAVFVDPTSYHYLTDYVSTTDQIMDWGSLFVVAVLCAGVFSGEKKRGLHSVLFSTENGRGWLARRKAMLSLAFSAMVYILFAAVRVANIANSYGLQSLGAPAHSLPIFSQCPVNWSIGSVLLGYILSGWLVYAVVAMIACLLSQVTSYVLGVFLTLSTIALPGVFSMAGLEFFNKWNIRLVEEQATAWVTQGDWGPMVFLGGILSVLAVCVCWIWKTGKKGVRT